jgi:hypothetical protein
VYRGWSGTAPSCRAAYRGIYSPGKRYNYLGFRLLFKYPVALVFFTLLLLSVFGFDFCFS